MLKNKKLILITSFVIILLPILFGLMVWNKLPSQMPIHWGIDGNIDGFSSRIFAVCGLPVFLFFVHWFCIVVTYKDPKNKDQDIKVYNMIFWICPVISIFVSTIIYLAAFEINFNIGIFMLGLIGCGFIIIGHYLPRCKPNHTIGIRIKWTLETEKNWNATHRMAGRLWVVGGVLFILSIFLPKDIMPWVLIILIPFMVIIPIIYSYVHYRNRK